MKNYVTKSWHWHFVDFFYERNKDREAINPYPIEVNEDSLTIPKTRDLVSMDARYQELNESARITTEKKGI